MEQSLNEYLHTSRQHLRLPIVQPSRCEGEIVPHAAQYAPLISQRGSCDTRLNGHHPIARVTSWPEIFRGKAILPTLGTTALYSIAAVSLDMCGI